MRCASACLYAVLPAFVSSMLHWLSSITLTKKLDYETCGYLESHCFIVHRNTTSTTSSTDALVLLSFTLSLFLSFSFSCQPAISSASRYFIHDVVRELLNALYPMSKCWCQDASAAGRGTGRVSQAAGVCITSSSSSRFSCLSLFHVLAYP